MYIYNRQNWPDFTWDEPTVNQVLLDVKFVQGRLLGRMEALGFEAQEQAFLATLTSEVVKSSEIEGEKLNPEEVRFSIARHLGLDVGGLLPAGRHIDGIVEMLLDATSHYDVVLSEQRLLRWHAALFPSSLSGLMLVNPGVWRNDSGGPMQVVSGHYGRERVHFRAPSADVLREEIALFIKWFNKNQRDLDPIVKAAIAHLWFVTLHPFDDGNGRISRAIADMALAKAENISNRFYSMSTQIRKDRKSYYHILELTQKGSLDITQWLLWFCNCLRQAIKASDQILNVVLNKAKFWEQHANKRLNIRQTQMLNMLFDGIKGKLTSTRWAKITKCSQDTATRDINSLIALDILIKSPQGGRSTCYLLKDYPINRVD